MTYFFYFIISFVLLIFQTVVLNHIPFFKNFYDLFLILILYIGLFRPVAEGVPVVFFLGLFVDGISGSPFWVYTTSYIWLLVLIKWLIQYFDAKSIILLPFAILAGVVLENCFFIIVSSGFDIDARFTLNSVDILIPQFVWAVFSGPVFIVFLKRIHDKIGRDALSGETAGRDKQ